MSTDYLNFLEQNSSKNESVPADVPASNDFVNLTLRADAECQVLCDGDFFVLLNANQIVKEKGPTGQHILQFISISRPDIQVEKIVDFPDAGKNYLVLVNEFTALMKEPETKMSVSDSQSVPEPVQTKDDEERRIFENYLERVNQDDSSALIKLANCYYKGIGVDKDEDNAVIYYERVIDESEEVDDLQEAVKGIKELAEQGNAEAQNILGDMYDGLLYPDLMEHNIIQSDDELAFYWYKKAANNGSAKAMVSMGDYYHFQEDDFEKAEAWYKRAIQVSGAEEGINELYRFYESRGMEEEVEECRIKYGF